LAERMDCAEQLTEANRALTLFTAFNYGGRAEILHAAARFTEGGEQEFRSLLYAPEIHDPEVIIRTGVEQRLSNFLLWHAAYAELVFRDVLWPDFTRDAQEQSLQEYGERRRRFGGR
jgi:undecaprenyl diphosphate synthase